jgi:pyruvate/2-oxoglutarate dehydrogenase complex dihydrolipoamide acyltransferase (E2) component
MAKIQNELKTILKALAGLSKKVEKLVGQTGQITPTKAAAPAKKAAPKKAAAKKAAPKAKAKAAKKPAAKKPAAAKKEKESAQGNTVIDTVLSAVKGSKAGIKIADLKTKTGIGGRQLSNALYKLTKRNLIKTTDRGIYTAV